MYIIYITELEGMEDTLYSYTFRHRLKYSSSDFKNIYHIIRK